jgi:transcriptional regulator with GAF, ATPase, and Fis domain
VNCGQFSDENLMASELFGHVKGSFTGAIHDHRGVFESANGGVILLDEVGELSLAAQKMLLRVIDYQEVRPVGAPEIKHVDIRVISATNRDLPALIETGKFREDLYYRLSCLHLHVPALRERGQDRLLLLDCFLRQLNHKYNVTKRFSAKALAFIGHYSFPGNVRELKNIVETGFYVSQDHIIHLEDITEKVQQLRKGDLLSHELVEYYSRMIDQGECFLKVVREPFLNRELNRSQVKAIVRKGLETFGNYKKLARAFNVQDYKSFLNFLYAHGLKP